MATQNDKGNVITSQPSLRDSHCEEERRGKLKQSHDGTVNNKQIASAKTPRNDVPKLRFKEFVGEWEKNELGKTCTVKTGGSDTQDRVDNGKYPFFVRSNTVERINSYSFDGEAILTSGDGVGVGKNFHYINGKFDFHQRVYALHTFKEGYYGKFIHQVFVEKFYKRVMRLSAKNSVDSVRMSMITEMKMGFPKLPEQQKIANFLTAVDTKLQQLTTKKETLALYKKGVMQQLFSQQLRFKSDGGGGFGDWEEKRLGEVGEIIGGGTPDTTNSDYWDGDIQWFTPTEVSNKMIDNSKRTITSLGLKKSSARLLPKGTILFTSRATIAELSFAKEECTTNQGFQSIVVNVKNNSEFVYYLINNNKKEFIRKSQGSTFLEISKNEMKKIKMIMPCLKEQQKIANYLSAIDKKIETVQRQITQTQAFKKGLLQGMFV